MNNRNVDFPVRSTRRKELEEALFRESMGFGDEDTFQQVLGQQQVEDRTQSWADPVDQRMPIPTAAPVPMAPIAPPVPTAGPAPVVGPARTPVSIGQAAQQREIGKARLGEIGDAAKRFLFPYPDRPGEQWGTAEGGPAGARDILTLLTASQEIAGAYLGPMVEAIGVGQVPPREAQRLELNQAQFVKERMAQVSENISGRPLPESLGEHLQRPIEERLIIEAFVDPLNLAVPLVGAVRSLKTAIELTPGTLIVSQFLIRRSTPAVAKWVSSVASKLRTAARKKGPRPGEPIIIEGKYTVLDDGPLLEDISEKTAAWMGTRDGKEFSRLRALPGKTPDQMAEYRGLAEKYIESDMTALVKKGVQQEREDVQRIATALTNKVAEKRAVGAQLTQDDILAVADEVAISIPGQRDKVQTGIIKRGFTGAGAGTTIRREGPPDEPIGDPVDVTEKPDAPSLSAAAPEAPTAAAQRSKELTEGVTRALGPEFETPETTLAQADLRVDEARAALTAAQAPTPLPGTPERLALNAARAEARAAGKPLPNKRQLERDARKTLEEATVARNLAAKDAAAAGIPPSGPPGLPGDLNPSDDDFHDKALAWFKAFVSDPQRINDWAILRQWRSDELAGRFANAQDAIPQLIEQGYLSDMAIEMSKSFMQGPLSTLETGIRHFVTPAIEDVLYKELLFQLDGDMPEILATHKALKNALAGHGIPATPGGGTPTGPFPEGGSALLRLQRVFGNEMVAALPKKGDKLSDTLIKRIKKQEELTPFEPIGEMTDYPSTQVWGAGAIRGPYDPTKTRQVFGEAPPMERLIPEGPVEVLQPPEQPLFPQAPIPYTPGEPNLLSPFEQEMNALVFRQFLGDIPGISRQIDPVTGVAETMEAYLNRLMDIAARPMEQYPEAEIKALVSEEEAKRAVDVVTGMTAEGRPIRSLQVQEPYLIERPPETAPGPFPERPLDPRTPAEKEISAQMFSEFMGAGDIPGISRLMPDPRTGQAETWEAYLQRRKDIAGRPTEQYPEEEVRALVSEEEAKRAIVVDESMEVQDPSLIERKPETAPGPFSGSWFSKLSPVEQAKKMKELQRIVKAFEGFSNEDKIAMIRWGKEAGLTAIDVGNLLRANMASFDMSYLRQQSMLIPGNPVKFAQSFPRALRAAWSASYAHKIDNEIMNDPLYEKYYLQGADFLRVLGTPESNAWSVAEEFMVLSGNRPLEKLARKLPWLNISNRAFITGTNYMNWQIYKGHMRTLIHHNEQWAAGHLAGQPVEYAGLRTPSYWPFTPGIKDKMLSDADIARSMNNVANMLAEMSARGPTLGLKKWTPGLNAGFFSFRTATGRLLSPRHMMSGDPFVRRAAWKNMLTYVASMSSLILAGEKMGVWDVETDPRSSDFMKIKLAGGRLTIDPWGGTQQYAVLYARLLPGLGGIKSVETGAVSDYDIATAGARFALNKRSPGAAAIMTLVWGKDYRGKEVDRTDWKMWLEDHLMMSVQDAMDAYKAAGLLGLYVGIPSGVFGGGVIQRELTLNDISMREYDMPYYDLVDVNALKPWQRERYFAQGGIDKRKEVRKLLALEISEEEKARRKAEKERKDAKTDEVNRKRMERELEIQKREREERGRYAVPPGLRVTPVPSKQPGEAIGGGSIIDNFPAPRPVGR